jgi:hypothetical protein
VKVKSRVPTVKAKSKTHESRDKDEATKMETNSTRSTYEIKDLEQLKSLGMKTPEFYKKIFHGFGAIRVDLHITFSAGYSKRRDLHTNRRYPC